MKYHSINIPYRRIILKNILNFFYEFKDIFSDEFYACWFMQEHPPPKAIRGTNHNHDAPQPSKNKAKTTNHAHNGAEKYANPSITMRLLILQIHFYP